jgi:hypothetical protein
VINTNRPSLQQAVDLLERGRRQEAANVLTVLLVDDPYNAEAWWLIALAANEPSLIRRALTRVLQLRPDDVRARHMLDGLNLRQAQAQSKRDTQEWLHYSQSEALTPHPSTFTAEYARPFEDSRPILRRRSGGRAYPPRIQRGQPQHKFGAFPIVLAMAALFGLIGCFVLAFAAMNGLELVGQAISEFNPSLPTISLPMGAVSVSANGSSNMTVAGTLSYFQFEGGTIATQGEQHAYTFTGAQGDFALIELNAVNGLLDPVLSLYGPDGNVLATNDDIAVPTNLNARLALSLPYDGTYTIVVSGKATQGQYQVSLRRS